MITKIISVLCGMVVFALGVAVAQAAAGQVLVSPSDITGNCDSGLNHVTWGVGRVNHDDQVVETYSESQTLYNHSTARPLNTNVFGEHYHIINASSSCHGTSTICRAPDYNFSLTESNPNHNAILTMKPYPPLTVHITHKYNCGKPLPCTGPLANQYVSVHSGSTYVASGRTNANGDYTIGLYAGSYTVSSTHANEIKNVSYSNSSCNPGSVGISFSY